MCQIVLYQKYLSQFIQYSILRLLMCHRIILKDLMLVLMHNLQIIGLLLMPHIGWWVLVLERMLKTMSIFTGLIIQLMDKIRMTLILFLVDFFLSLDMLVFYYT